MRVLNPYSSCIVLCGTMVCAMLVGAYACLPMQKDKERTMKLQWELIPEDVEQHLYTLTWNDTLGQAEALPITQRPLEVWCIITNQQHDTVGYYQGLSSPRDFLGFQSEDSIVEIHFAIGMNFFSNHWQTAKQYEVYRESNKLPVLFVPIKVNLHKDLRHLMDKVLTERSTQH